MIEGAGGTKGGIVRFFVGFVMMCGGFYMLLQSITVTTSYGLGMQLLGIALFGSSFGITSGMIMIPFIFGVGWLFYNGKSVVAWMLTIGSMAAMIFGVIASTHFMLRTMTAFELITILVLCFGGLGILASSLGKSEKKESEKAA
jgi:hypothetical protein